LTLYSHLLACTPGVTKRKTGRIVSDNEKSGSVAGAGLAHIARRTIPSRAVDQNKAALLAGTSTLTTAKASICFCSLLLFDLYLVIK
jgi:hypothetical protein